MENVRRIDWGRPRCVGRARERRRCETVTRVFAIQFANTWNIYTCEQSDMEASFGSANDTLGNSAIFEIDAHLNDPSFHPRSCHDSSNRSLLSPENQNFVNR